MGLDLVLRSIPDAAAIVITSLVHWQFRLWAKQAFPRHRRGAVWGVSVLWGLAAIAYLVSLPGLNRLFPLHPVIEWTRGAGMAWSIVSTVLCGVLGLLRWAGHPDSFDPGRRAALHAAAAAAVAAPVAALGYGCFIGRHRITLAEVDISVSGLPRDLDGLRLVQITDIHLSPFFSEQELERAIGIANETKAHAALVTGDLISLRRDPLEKCLALLTRLRSDAGTFGCLGNHEIVAGCEVETWRRGERLGIKFLRRQAVDLRFGGASIRLAGADYQRKSQQYLVGMDRLVHPGRYNILLSHNPDVFPVAARQGYDLTLAGHTHGGQVTVEILPGVLNVARFVTPYIHGQYALGSRRIYVSRGLGTVGMPVRFGAPPEVSLIRLCAT